MKIKFNAKYLGALALAIIAATSLLRMDAKGGGSTDIPATTTFHDNGDRIASDGLGPYSDGQYNGGSYCGSSHVSGNQYFFRSVLYSCSASQNTRTVNLDLSSPVPGAGPTTCDPIYDSDGSGASLNPCTVNAIPDLRIIATQMFASRAFSKSTTVIVPFSLQPEFSGNADFELDFDQPVAVLQGSTAGERILSAGPLATAHLYQMVGSRKVNVGQYYMPFTLTVTETP